jgi:hypothetical protein
VRRRVDDRAVPEALRRFNFIFFDEAASFDAQVDRLAEALSTDIAWIRKHIELGAQAHDWSAAGKPARPCWRRPSAGSPPARTGRLRPPRRRRKRLWPKAAVAPADAATC